MRCAHGVARAALPNPMMQLTTVAARCSARGSLPMEGGETEVCIGRLQLISPSLGCLCR